MRVSLAAKQFAPDGFVQFDHAGPPQESVRRRVSKVPTLDQSVAITDRGYSHGDRAMLFRFPPVSVDHNRAILRLIRLYQLVEVSFDEGVYDALITFDPDTEENTVTASIVRKISEE
jgi:hypothetical protein